MMRCTRRPRTSSISSTNTTRSASSTSEEVHEVATLDRFRDLFEGVIELDGDGNVTVDVREEVSDYSATPRRRPSTPPSSPPTSPRRERAAVAVRRGGVERRKRRRQIEAVTDRRAGVLGRAREVGLTAGDLAREFAEPPFEAVAGVEPRVEQPGMTPLPRGEDITGVQPDPRVE